MKKRQVFRLCLLALFFCGVIWLYPRLHGLDAETILEWVPERPLAAALVLLLLYAAKGLSFFFPLAVLEAVGGLLFPVPQALALNVLGVTVAVSLPYLLGRREQVGLDSLVQRLPHLERLREFRENSDFLFVLLVRITGIFPCDAVSFYLGASGIPYQIFLPASLLGVLPHLTAVTILGSALSDRSSEAFLISIAANAVVTAGALTIWRIQKKRRAA